MLYSQQAYLRHIEIVVRIGLRAILNVFVGNHLRGGIIVCVPVVTITAIATSASIIVSTVATIITVPCTPILARRFRPKTREYRI